MKFSRRSETLSISGQDVTVFELSVAEFAAVTAIEDEAGQGLELLRASLNGAATVEEINDWPNTIAKQITEAVLSINGLTDPGN